MSLYGTFLRNQNRVCYKCKQYFPVYERYFARYCNTSVVMFEIGVRDGGSLQMWKEYLGPHAVIVGIDKQPQCKEVEEDQIHVRIGSQSDVRLLAETIDEFGAPDIVLDDGSHQAVDQVTTFDFLYPKMMRSGVYIVEDTMTSYASAYGGGYRVPTSFIETAKSKVDDLHDRYWNGGKRGEFARMTQGVAFFDSMVIFEKGFTSGRVMTLQTGTIKLGNDAERRKRRRAIRRQRIEARQNQAQKRETTEA